MSTTGAVSNVSSLLTARNLTPAAAQARLQKALPGEQVAAAAKAKPVAFTTQLSQAHRPEPLFKIAKPAAPSPAAPPSLTSNAPGSKSKKQHLSAPTPMKN